MIRWMALVLFLLVGTRPAAWSSDGTAIPLHQEQLVKEDTVALAKAARENGDAGRGAIIFHRPQLLCTKCHETEDGKASLGPPLSKAGRDVSDVYLIESILLPSKVIKKGYETISVAIRTGRSISGLLVEDRPDKLVLRDPTGDAELITIDKRDIEVRDDKAPSIMPEGLINQLGSRQEFLDLVRYLMEIAAGGPEREKQLRPAPSLYAPPPLPEYEKHIDHAGMIADWNAKSLKRGEVIYNRLCINCHGTKDQPGSLPTSLRFAEGKFKNGSDPFRMYATLTHGFGMMTPQTWMVPRQKYDVIQYIREAYLKPFNPSQYARIEKEYLAGLPKGDTRGPAPSTIEPWASMDYGPNLNATYEIGNDGSNFAHKGIAIRLDAGPGGVSRGRHWMVFEHDTLRVAAAWSGEGFIDWQGVNFNGRHEIHPRVVGQVQFANPNSPGWANPEDGSFHDPRLKGRDGRPYGPLPRASAHFQGLYHYGQHVILSYTLGKACVLEMPGYEVDVANKNGDGIVFTRTLNITKSPRDLLLRVAPRETAVAVIGGEKTRLLDKDGYKLLHVPASATPLTVKLLMARGNRDALRAFAKTSPPPMTLEPLTKGGSKRWPDVLKTQAVLGGEKAAFAVDVLAHPKSNPWLCQMRFTGFDFYPDGKRAAICSWDGDVWLVGGIDHPQHGLTWQRIASGLFQPLGLKIVNGRIHVCCRDQIVVLHDLNGDGEIDFYENFNSDHQLTEHFHEFAMGLQTDADGNFYYAKAARHAKTALVPHHGTLLRVSKDGSRTDILATGFRAPNGVCLNRDGTFFLTDQEGHWTPKNRINRVETGGFYGNMWGYHEVADSLDSAMRQPVCWITNRFDRSPSELLWVEGKAWGPLQGALLNFSYGYGKVYVVMHEKVGRQWQGGMVELPIPQFPTGVMRGRFHPTNGQLYCCGMFAWAGNQTQPGGFYRVRTTGKPVYVPVELLAKQGGLEISFTGVLDQKSACDLANYTVTTWSLKRTANYGSEHYDEKPAKVSAARLAADGKTVMLAIEGLKPTWCMEIKYSIKSMDGELVRGVIHNTIHNLQP